MLSYSIRMGSLLMLIFMGRLSIKRIHKRSNNLELGQRLIITKEKQNTPTSSKASSPTAKCAHVK